jgi:hypothetical protein
VVQDHAPFDLDGSSTISVESRLRMCGRLWAKSDA